MMYESAYNTDIAVNLGTTAQHRGIPLDSNPYNKQQASELWMKWQYGWLKGYMKSEMESFYE